MEVILLERIGKLGQMGDTVRVKDGFARNFLLAKGKALRATRENKARFETMRKELEARNLENRGEAEKVASKLNGKSFVVLRQASETGQLFGSVTTRDLAALIGEGGFTVNRNQVVLNVPIKTIGQHKVPVALHPDVDVSVLVNVARSADEAERIAQSENVSVARTDPEIERAELAANAEAFFEPGAQAKDDEETESGEDAGGKKAD